MLDYSDQFISGVLVVFGVTVATHYHAMANFMRRAPHFVKLLLLPLITGAGVGMAYCGWVGSNFQGALFGTLCAGSMTVVNLAAWRSGAYVSDKFDKAARLRKKIRRDAWVLVREYDQLADAFRSSNHAPMDEALKKQQLEKVGGTDEST